jgi:predicted CoA-binding protein
LDNYLERIAGPGGKEQVACIIETTHGLLIAHLLEQGWAVYPVNPRTQEAWAREYYQRKRAEGKSHTVAVRALANVWARVVYAVWKKKELYQTTTFVQARQAHAPRVA